MRDGNAYSIDITNGTRRQLTDIRGGAEPAGARTRSTDSAPALEAQLEAAARGGARQSRAGFVREIEKKPRDALLAEDVSLAPNERVGNIVVSPNGKRAVLDHATTRGRGRTHRERSELRDRERLHRGHSESHEGRRRAERRRASATDAPARRREVAQADRERRGAQPAGRTSSAGTMPARGDRSSAAPDNFRDARNLRVERRPAR